MQARRARLELRLRAGAREPRAPDMGIEIDLAVLDPDRVRDRQGKAQEPAPENRDEVNAACQVPLDVGVEIPRVSLRQVVEMQRADVHRRRRRFEVQEQRIETGERLQSGYSAVSGSLRMCVRTAGAGTPAATNALAGVRARPNR